MQLEPYINFNGKCEEALEFYKGIFNGEVVQLMRFENAPMREEGVDPKKIMHASFVAGDVRFMASDAMGSDYKPGDNISMCISTKDAPAAERVFNALAAGGTVQVPFSDQFWGAKFGMLDDKYGIPWMINCETSGG